MIWSVWWFSGAGYADSEDLQVGSALCWTPVSVLHFAASLPGARSGQLFHFDIFAGVGSPCLGCTRRHSHLLVSGHHLIKWLTHYTLTLSLFYLFQVYFAERENQISLGDLEAVNCTGWVEGPNNEYRQFVIKRVVADMFYESKSFRCTLPPFP